jgi:hypothetical protein
MVADKETKQEDNMDSRPALLGAVFRRGLDDMPKTTL